MGLRIGRIALGGPTALTEAIGDQTGSVGGAVVPAPRTPLRFQIALSTYLSNAAMVVERQARRRQTRSALNNGPLKFQRFLYIAYPDDPEQDGWYVPDVAALGGVDDASWKSKGLWQTAASDWVLAGHQRTHREARGVWMKDLTSGRYPRDTLDYLRSTDFAALPTLALSVLPNGVRQAADTVSGAVVSGAPLPAGRDGGVCEVIKGLVDLQAVGYERDESDMNVSDVIVYDRGGNLGPFGNDDAYDFDAGLEDPQGTYGWNEVYGPDWPWSWFGTWTAPAPLPPPPPPPTPPPPGDPMPWRTIMDGYVILDDNGVYNAFPGVCVTPDSHLLAIWRSGSSHLSADGVLKASRTTDLTGQTGWSAPTTIWSVAGDVGNGPVAVLANGHIVVASPVSTNGGASWSPEVRVSTDNGVTWGTAAAVSYGFSAANILNVSPIVETATPNTLLLASYAADTGSENYVRFSKSTDGGATWADAGVIVPSLSGWQYNEPWLIRLASGRYFMTLRVVDNSGNHDLYTMHTDDPDGLTGWTTPTLSLQNVNGSPATLETPDGDIILITRPNTPPNPGCILHVTRDEGATWSARQYLSPIPQSGGRSNYFTMDYAQAAYVAPADNNENIVFVCGFQHSEDDTICDVLCAPLTRPQFTATPDSNYDNAVLATAGIARYYTLADETPNPADAVFAADAGTDSAGVTIDAFLGIPADSSVGRGYTPTSYTDLGTGAALNLCGTPGTVELLFIANSFGSDQILAYASSGDWQVWITAAGHLAFQYAGGGFFTDPATLSTGTLYHAAVAMDRNGGEIAYLYKNGSLVNSAGYSEANTPATYPRTRISHASAGFDGTIAKFAMYYLPLDATTIHDHAVLAGVA